MPILSPSQFLFQSGLVCYNLMLTFAATSVLPTRYRVETALKPYHPNHKISVPRVWKMAPYSGTFNSFT